MKVSFHEVTIVSNLYEAGRQDDGVPFVAESYFLQVTKPNGDRLDHHVSFPGCKVGFDEDGWPFFEDIRAKQLRRALRLRRAIRRAGRIDLRLWSAGRPVYGSAAYVQYGSADDLALEREEG